VAVASHGVLGKDSAPREAAFLSGGGHATANEDAEERFPAPRRLQGRHGAGHHHLEQPRRVTSVIAPPDGPQTKAFFHLAITGGNWDRAAMKTKIASLAVICSLLIVGEGFAVEPAATTGRQTIKLVSGDTMTGTVGAVRDGSLSLITEYGPVRIPVEKLSAETKTRLGVSAEADVEGLRARVRELEDLVVRLREENAGLRHGATPVVPTAGGGTSPGARPTSAPSAGDGGVGGYKISNTGKRHNSRCRYFNSAGRAGSATEGVACKVCGG